MHQIDNVQYLASASIAMIVRKLRNKIGRAIHDYQLIGNGDHILVCLSGGKDSFTLLTMLQELQTRAPIRFDLTAFHLHQCQPGYPEGVMETYLAKEKMRYVIHKEDTCGIVNVKIPKGQVTCSLCSRLRRGIIYAQAKKLGCNKIALGHHRDDSIETLLLNLFYTGQLKAMPAKYTTDNGKFQVLRPMIYVDEESIITFAELKNYPIISCNLCSSQQTQRKQMKKLLKELEKSIPDVRQVILAAMGNIRPTHLLDLKLLASYC
jgi:tRNA 2-thiocytidine biosynthesis protein TtcA